MSSDVQGRLLAAVYACLRPLARILLRSGISYKQFADVAKHAFVREASSETDARGRPINTSRVAVRTGLSRKEVRKLLQTSGETAGPDDGEMLNHFGPPAKVLHAWHMDHRFLNDDGSPRDLPFDTGIPCFCDLVRAVAGDVPPGAVRAELKRAGAILDLDDGLIRAVKRYFVPADFDEKAITVISAILYPLTAGIDHNANPNRNADGFFQRIAYSDRIDNATVPMFRRWARTEATRFIESMDDWLAKNEKGDHARDEIGIGQIVGVGVFYYEGPPAESSTPATPVRRDD